MSVAKVAVLAAGAFAIACCAPEFAALAQEVAGSTTSNGQSYGLHRSPHPVSPPLSGGRPLFHLFGVPVVVNAPVAQPYANSAYNNVGGQPESSGDAVTQGFIPNR